MQPEWCIAVGRSRQDLSIDALLRPHSPPSRKPAPEIRLSEGLCCVFLRVIR